jgi:hypothetical protein
MTESDGDYVRFELRNSKPVDLLDLTGALSAFGDAYKDYVVSAGFEHIPDNVRLFVREIRSGSIIADLISMADQGSYILDHKETIAKFATHINDILQWLLISGTLGDENAPNKKETAQTFSVMEPVAKDSASQLKQCSPFIGSAFTYNSNVSRSNIVFISCEGRSIRKGGVTKE